MDRKSSLFERSTSVNHQEICGYKRPSSTGKDADFLPPIKTEGLSMDMQWLNEARCLTEDPELFFPVGNTGPAAEQIEQAKSVCRECTVSSSCLEYAIKENQDSGVWGGLSEDERKSLKRKYARARRAG
jgi:WhiB family redox-sensing transcriptional regulator